jgi:hypothetical protein
MFVRLILVKLFYFIGHASALAGQISVINPSSGSSVVISIPQSTPSTPNSYSGARQPISSVNTKTGDSRIKFSKDTVIETMLQKFDVSTFSSEELMKILKKIDQTLENGDLSLNKASFLEIERAKIVNAISSLQN